MTVACSSLAARSGLPASTQPAKTHAPVVNSQVATCPLRVRERAQRCSAGVLHITLTLSKLLMSNTFPTDTNGAHRPKRMPGSLKHLAAANGARRPTLPLYVNCSRSKSRALSSDPMVEIQHRLEFGTIATGGFVPMLAPRVLSSRSGQHSEAWEAPSDRTWTKSGPGRQAEQGTVGGCSEDDAREWRHSYR